MLDLGWSELLLVAVIAIVVVGPKDLPRALRTVGHWVAKVRGVAREFQSSVDDMIREAELDEIKKEAQAITDLNRPADEDLVPGHEGMQNIEPPPEALADTPDEEAAADRAYEDYVAEGAVAPAHSLTPPEAAPAGVDADEDERPASRANG